MAAPFLWLGLVARGSRGGGVARLFMIRVTCPQMVRVSDP